MGQDPKKLNSVRGLRRPNIWTKAKSVDNDLHRAVRSTLITLLCKLEKITQ